MAKAADYIITGVWFSETPHRHISHVMLHQVDDNGDMEDGLKATRVEALRLLAAGKTIRTATWDYNNQHTYSVGAYVETEIVAGVKYLRSHRDKTETDNLLNLLDMSHFGI